MASGSSASQSRDCEEKACECEPAKQYIVEEVEMLGLTKELPLDNRQIDSEDDTDPNWNRPYWYVVSCSVGGCNKKMFPNHFGCWSFQSDCNAPFRFALHLKKHQACKFKIQDALVRTFDYKLTTVEMAVDSYEERPRWREAKLKEKGFGCWKNEIRMHKKK